jgi:hypothetical protein
MLDKLRADALALIASTSHCILSTTGLAGIQASILTCVVHADCVYVLVPSTADQIVNLEQAGEVVLTTPLWQLRGVPLLLNETQELQNTAPGELRKQAVIQGYTVVEVFPLRMHIEATDQRPYRETIDFVLRDATHAWRTRFFRRSAHVTPTDTY